MLVKFIRSISDNWCILYLKLNIIYLVPVLLICIARDSPIYTSEGLKILSDFNKKKKLFIFFDYKICDYINSGGYCVGELGALAT